MWAWLNSEASHALKAQAHIFSFYKYFDAEKFQALLSTMLVFFPYARSMNCARVILINNLPKDLDIKYVHIRRIKKQMCHKKTCPVSFFENNTP